MPLFPVVCTANRLRIRGVQHTPLPPQAQTTSLPGAVSYHSKLLTRQCGRAIDARAVVPSSVRRARQADTTRSTVDDRARQGTSTRRPGRAPPQSSDPVPATRWVYCICCATRVLPRRPWPGKATEGRETAWGFNLRLPGFWVLYFYIAFLACHPPSAHLVGTDLARPRPPAVPRFRSLAGQRGCSMSTSRCAARVRLQPRQHRLLTPGLPSGSCPYSSRACELVRLLRAIQWRRTGAAGVMAKDSSPSVPSPGSALITSPASFGFRGLHRAAKHNKGAHHYAR